ncbi:MAG TPA: hypothetical protein PKK26_05805 [Candidatus Wallbacteria bacterium]|nr:hypothetical protein [Candidatus Wallbacteria bacterium]
MIKLSRSAKIIFLIIFMVFFIPYAPLISDLFWVPIDAFLDGTDDPFHRAIKDADRIVIREGGYDCCGPVNKQKVLAVITDPIEIKDISKNIKFSVWQSNSKCLCCGYPGIDWYRGGKLLALTAIQHGTAIRWKGFDHDKEFTFVSAGWLGSWLSGIPQIKPFRNR